MNIGATIKKLRIKNAITQQQLADCLHVNMQTVSRWETSATYPDIIMLPVLARYFHVSVDYLLNNGGNTMKPIISEKLLVREWNEDDAAGLLEVKRASSGFVNYLKIGTINDALECIRIWKEYQEMYPVILKQTNKFIGVAGLVDVNRYNGYRELEVHLCGEFYNLDYSMEAHKLMLDYGFGKLGLEVAFSYCSDDEEILLQTLKNVGFTYEGTLRKFGRDMSDRMRYSIIREDYRLPVGVLVHP